MHKTVSGIMLTLLLIGTLTLAFNIQPAEADLPEAWPMFRHNLNRTGYSPSKAPRTSQMLWSYSTEWQMFSSPAVVDGKVFFATNEGRLYCLDAYTGAFLWSSVTGTAFSSPAVANGKVFIGGFDFPFQSKIYALNATTGNSIWEYTIDSPIHFPIDSSPAVTDGMVFIGAFDGVYALNETTGALIWKSVIGSTFSSPAVADGVVFIGSDDGKLYALDEATGGHLWSFTTIGRVMSTPAISDGKVFVGAYEWMTYEGRVYSLNKANGELIWETQTGGISSSSPAVGYGKIFIGSSNENKVYALNASTGTIVWTYTMGQGTYSSPAIADGMVFIGSDDGKLYALDEATGTLVWSYAIADRVISSPSIAYGIVFVGAGEFRDQKFCAFGSATYALTITTTTGGTTNPAPGTYSYTANSTVQVTAIADANYLFDYWELDSVNVGSANPYTVTMDKNHTLKAVFSPIPPPLSASINPLSASILVGQSATFTSTVSGGHPPYSYQWYLNGAPVSEATANTWTFTPTTSGICYVYLKVTDAKGNTAQSDTARITVASVPVGGYSIPIPGQATAKPITPYLILTAILTIAFTAVKRRTTKKTKSHYNKLTTKTIKQFLRVYWEVLRKS